MNVLPRDLATGHTATKQNADIRARWRDREIIHLYIALTWMWKLKKIERSFGPSFYPAKTRFNKISAPPPSTLYKILIFEKFTFLSWLLPDFFRRKAAPPPSAAPSAVSSSLLCPLQSNCTVRHRHSQCRQRKIWHQIQLVLLLRLFLVMPYYYSRIH